MAKAEKKGTILNKADLIEKMAELGKVSKAEAEKQINATLAGVKALLATMKPDDKLQLVGQLAIEVYHKEAHKARNPKTKAEVDVPAKNLTKVKLGSELVGAVVQPTTDKPASKPKSAKSKK